MRRYFAKITDGGDHPKLDEDKVKIQDKPFGTLEKGVERPLNLMNVETGERFELKAVSLGYHDFDDQEDYRENVGDVIERKMEEAGVE